MIVSPLKQNTGLLLDEKLLTVTIENDGASDQTLTAFGLFNAGKDTVQGPPLPLVIPPGGIVTFFIEVSASGPGVFRSTFVATVSGVTLRSEYSGERGYVWPFKHDWSSSLETRYDYQTEVILSRDGSKQRRAMRSVPRFSLVSSFSLQGLDKIKYDLLTLNRGNQFVLMPDYSLVRTLGNVAVNTTDYSVGQITENDRLNVGSRVILRDNAGAEAYTIQSITSDTIRLSPGAVRNYVGARLYPAFKGLVNGGATSSDRPVSSAAVGSVTVNSVPFAGEERTLGLPELTYLDREVFTHRPNWADRIDYANQWGAETVDSDRGLIDVFFPQKHNVLIRRLSFVKASRSQVHDITNFFNRHLGQRTLFYSPTFEPDMSLAESALIGATEIVFKGSNFFDRFVSEVWRDIAVVGESITPLKIASVSLLGDTTVATLSAPLSANLLLSEVRMVCYMPLSAFATDSLSIRWVTDTVATVALAIETEAPLA